jgi:hypothetical protein
MAMVCSQPLSVVCEPGADVLIFGGREDDIAVSVIPVEGSVVHMVETGR